MGGLFSNDVINVYSTKACFDIPHQDFVDVIVLYFTKSELWLSANDFGHVKCFKQSLDDNKYKLKLLKSIPVTGTIVAQVKEFYDFEKKKQLYSSELNNSINNNGQSGDIEAVIYKKSFFDSVSDFIHQNESTTNELFIPSISICANNYNNRMSIYHSTKEVGGIITFISTDMANFFKEYVECYNKIKEIYKAYA